MAKKTTEELAAEAVAARKQKLTDRANKQVSRVLLGMKQIGLLFKLEPSQPQQDAILGAVKDGYEKMRVKLAEKPVAEKKQNAIFVLPS